MKAYSKTRHHNYKTRTGKLSQGCQLCVKGQKLVLFVTGICGNNCSYCPVSDNKNESDDTYANEWKLTSDTDLLEEARLTNAKGAGITGGDPLATMNKTLHYITLLKTTYGKTFHIHLYTPLLRINKTRLEQLQTAGLDELRLHPQLDNQQQWSRMKLARQHNWQLGIEVPVIPEHEQGLHQLLRYLAQEVKPDFVNLNEFEYADNKVFEQGGKHYQAKNTLSYGVKGSEELAKKLLLQAQELGLATHYCTAKSKDSVQLAKRLKRRAQRAAKPYDAVDQEGLLSRGAIYGPINITQANTAQELHKLSDKQRKTIITQLNKLRQKIIQDWEVPEELIELDTEHLRLLTTTSVAEHAAKTLNTTVALVKEYPTKDSLLIEAHILREEDTCASPSTQKPTAKKTSNKQ